ncbi:AAA family ATPase [Fibrella aquatilis]|uniref:ATP-binding protein n=1 Tax=Fibrella aquatilis TaxID=2817059 RepID=A0A939G2T4_9BACT|nr:AAA family ATPase [Fibrella aquatilis]MBO0931287.1 ATP-binding protein [Fibrella aquatilis]
METNAPDTSNFLDWVEIKNFKSIKDLRLDCKRVNVFIGKPNVGKSNILEALGMLGAELYTDGFMNDVARYKDIRHLFYENDKKGQIKVSSDKSTSVLQGSFTNNYDFDYYSFPSKADIPRHKIKDYVLDNGGLLWYVSNTGKITVDQKRQWNNSSRSAPYKSYTFRDIDNFVGTFETYLMPPDGKNLFDIIDSSKELKNEFGKMFLNQGLDLVLDQENQSFTIQKKDGFYIYKYDYFTIADTFRRFMFYIAAIESNKNSVLIFEEPEVHSFPPYTQDVAYRMIYSTDNQFFVSTHSPYLLQTLVENMNDDQLSVFVTYYENYETKVKALTPEELSFVQEYSTDVFFNLDRFIPTPNAAIIS